MTRKWQRQAYFSVLADCPAGEKTRPGSSHAYTASRLIKEGNKEMGKNYEVQVQPDTEQFYHLHTDEVDCVFVVGKLRSLIFEKFSREKNTTSWVTVSQENL